MAKNLNSATRLLLILEQVPAHKGNAQACEVWAKILNVTEEHPLRRAVAVGELVHAMHRELGIASTGLATANFSKELYERPFSRIENAISPLVLAQPWDAVKQYLTSDVLTALSFCVEILPDEETQISGDDLASIREKVEELRATLDDATMPLRLRSLIQHHVELIEKALAEYVVVGAKALREAGRTALGEMIEAKDEVALAKDSPAVSILEKTWKQVNNAADVALKGEKLGSLGQKAWEALSGLL